MSETEMSPANPSILIIGAGISGISAATKLFDNGIKNITVLEAKDYIGGRIKSIQFGTHKIDLGAQWCHGEKGNIVYDLVKDLNCLKSSFNDYEDFTFYTSAGAMLEKSITDNFFHVASTLFDNSERTDESFGEFFDQKFKEEIFITFGENDLIVNLSKLLMPFFHKMYLCYDAADSWYNVPCSPGPYTFCEGNQHLNWGTEGFKTLIDILLKQFPYGTSDQILLENNILLNKEVTKIVWDDKDDDEVKVNCADGSSYSGDHVLVTIPLGALKNNHEKLFNPALPSLKVNAIEGIGMGSIGKIFLKFSTRWWPDDFKGMSFIWLENDRQNLCKEFPAGPFVNGKCWLEDILGFYVVDEHPTILLGWIVGDMVALVESLSEEAVYEGCCFLLQKFANSVFSVEKPIEILRSKWKTDKFFCGSYSTITLETEKRGATADHLAEPLKNSRNEEKVLFAGEHTHNKYFSTVHGALETGYREADRLLAKYATKSHL